MFRLQTLPNELFADIIELVMAEGEPVDFQQFAQDVYQDAMGLAQARLSASWSLTSKIGGVVINKERQLHLPMRFRAARPDDDGPVTLESFFDKVVLKSGRRDIQVDLIQATFDQGSIFDDEVFHSTETHLGPTGMLHRTGQDAWEIFFAKNLFPQMATKTSDSK